jgi:hypothetical protein
MMPHARLGLVFALLVLLAGACSDDPPTDVGGVTGSTVRDEVPALPLPSLRIVPSFATSDSLARYARGTVVGQLNRVLLVSRDAESTHATFNVGGWEEARPGCRVRELGARADTVCSYTLWLCGTDGGYEYSEVLNGPCVATQAPFSDWTHVSGVSSADGTTGDFRSFQTSRSGAVSRAWSWQSSPDFGVIDWSFYNGDRRDSNFAGALHWDGGDPDLARVGFRWSRDQKWEAEIARDGRSGRMTVLALDPASNTWHAREEIAWLPAHGTWDTYDATGILVEARSW